MKEKLVKRIATAVPEGAKILVGVSGGPDSMALLHLLLALKEEKKLTLSVAHVNHGMRPSAGEEAAYVASVAEDHGLSFFLKEADVLRVAAEEKIGEEMAGRRVRYRFFSEILEQTGGVLATAHHKDDQIETVLLHLMRGSGLNGLCGMAQKGAVLRPLLSVSKEEILRYLEEEKIRWVLDESNLSPVYLRNRLRHELLPVMRKIEPGVEEALFTLAENARDAQSILSDTVHAFYEQARVKKSEILIPKDAYQAQSPALQREIIREAVRRLNTHAVDLTRAHTLEIQKVWTGASGRGTELLGLQFLVTQEGLLVRRPVACEAFSFPVPREGEVELPDGRLRVFAASAEEEMQRREDVLYLPETVTNLRIRTRQPGDRIRGFGTGGEKSVAKAMKDLKIRNDLRESWPLLCEGSKVYWIAGRQKSEESRMEPGTRAIGYQYIGREDEDARI